MKILKLKKFLHLSYYKFCFQLAELKNRALCNFFLIIQCFCCHRNVLIVINQGKKDKIILIGFERKIISFFKMKAFMNINDKNNDF